MDIVADRTAEPTVIRTDLGAIFISMELRRSSWLITSLSPGNGAKMSKHGVRAGDVARLLERFSRLREKAQARTGRRFAIIVIQEAGLDGFWVHRVLQGGSDRELHRRSRFDSDLASSPAGQDRQA